jgi:glycerophosphoryl diester phosphodiesterase
VTAIEVQRADGERPAGPLILAHRGDWTVERENSLGAFAAAAARPGVDGV